MFDFNAKWFGESVPNTELRLPLIFTYLLSKASKPSDIIDLVFDMRSSKEASKFREKCRELNETRNNDPHLINKKLKEMDNELKKIENGFDLMSTDQISVSASLPYGISISAPIVSLFEELIKRGRKHFVFIRDIFKGTDEPRGIHKAYQSKLQSEI